MTIYSRSVTSALTIVGSPTAGANVFNPVVVQSIGLGQRQGRAFDFSNQQSLILSDLLNYQPLENLDEALYFAGIVEGVLAGKLLSNGLTFGQSITLGLIPNRTIEDALTFNSYVSAFITGQRETCVLQPSGSCLLTVITSYSGQPSSALAFSDSVVVAGTFNANVVQNLNLVQSYDREGTFTTTASSSLVFFDSANQVSISVPTASNTAAFTDEASGVVV